MKKDEQPTTDGVVAQTLAGLKRRGCSLLYVGASCSAHADACDRASGADSEGVRRLLVRTDRYESCVNGDVERVIDVPTPTRRAATVSSTPSVPETDRLAREIAAEMQALAADVDRIGGVRVCFDSLRPFVEVVDDRHLRAFLEELSDAARETEAVVHTHLPATLDAIPVWLFECFDAVIEVSGQGETTFQRWHFPDCDTPTEWVEV